MIMIALLLLGLFIEGGYGQSPITCGDRKTGQIASGETVTYIFSITTATTVTFSNCDSDFDTLMHLSRTGQGDITEAESDNRCNGDDCGACSSNRREEMTFTNLRAGTYSLRLTPYDSGGSYVITATCAASPTTQAPVQTSAPTPATPSSPCSNAGVLTGTINANGQAVTGSIGRGESILYRLTIGSSMNNVVFSNCGSSFDTQMNVYDSSCSIISSGVCGGDDCGSCSNGFSNREIFTMPSLNAGTYYVQLRPYNIGGTYEIVITPPTVPPPTTKPPTNRPTTTKTPTSGTPCSNVGVLTGNINANGQAVTGSIGDGESILYRLTIGSSINNVVFSNCGSSFDTQMNVYDSSCSIISSGVCGGDDCGSCSNVNREIFTMPSLNAGTYYVQLEPYDSGGRYEIVVTPPAPTPPPTAPTTRPPTSPTPPPTAPDCCTKRCRRPWNTMSQTDRNLYINAFKQLTEDGVIQSMSNSHGILFSQRIHNTELFLPWHRAYLLDLENKIRALGGDYTCFGLPYWDWSAEATPSRSGSLGPVIFRSGLGEDSGGCLRDGTPFASNYDPPYVPSDTRLTTTRFSSTACLHRNAGYSSNSDCLFSQPSQLMDIIDNSNGVHSTFTNTLEGAPHALPHICVAGNMASVRSPDDPIFYLHHCFVDYLFALWQDCHNYDGMTTTSDSNQYDGDINEPLTLPHNTANPDRWTVADVINQPDTNVIYAKGPFWSNARVDAEDNCGAPALGDTINNQWFYNDGSMRRRLNEEQDYAQRLYEELKANGGYGNEKNLKHAWAVKVCQYEEMQNLGALCEQSDDFDDCSDWELDPETNDIIATKDDLLNRDGLTWCQRQTVNNFWDYAVMVRSVQRLCAGCFDPICDRTGIDAKCNAMNQGPKRGAGGAGGAGAGNAKSAGSNIAVNTHSNHIINKLSKYIQPEQVENKYGNLYDNNNNNDNKWYNDYNNNNNVYNDGDDNNNKNVNMFYMIIGIIAILLICNIVLMVKFWCNRSRNNEVIRYKTVDFESDTEFADSDANLIS